jgi:hypothetical protein
MTRSRLLLTDFKRGFTDEDAGALRRLLQDFRDGREHRIESDSPSLWARSIA